MSLFHQEIMLATMTMELITTSTLGKNKETFKLSSKRMLIVTSITKTLISVLLLKIIVLLI